MNQVVNPTEPTETRARISAIMLKTGYFTFGAAFAGLGMIAVAGLAKSSLWLIYGAMVSAGGIGGGMAISAILYQLQQPAKR